MLDLLFGFNARLGRLQYVLASVGLAFVMTAICFAIVASGLVHFPSGTTRSQLSQLSWATLGWPVLGTAAFAMWATFTIQAMRIRDIGWDPVCVIGGWIAVMIIDMIVATKIPALASGPSHYGTIVGSLVNLGMTGVLLFWPGDDA
jgi:uncharacterized membrane protein YhaH (DUF805 family)